MQTSERQARLNPDYEKRSWLTLGLFACFKTSKMESSITATPPSCQWKGEKGIISRRYVCVVIPVCISLFCECLASLLSQFFAMPKAHFSFGCISSQCQKVASARFVLHVSVCSIFFFFAIIPVYEIFKESARQLLVWASLCHINEARDLCRAHSLSGYNNTWSLPPVRARIKGKKCSLCIVHWAISSCFSSIPIMFLNNSARFYVAPSAIFI